MFQATGQAEGRATRLRVRLHTGLADCHQRVPKRHVHIRHMR